MRRVLERRPASAVVVELVYPKFVGKDRVRNEATEILVAPAVELPIERGVAGPGMLADTIVRRWQDYQPLNRLEICAATFSMRSNPIPSGRSLPYRESALCSESNGPSRTRREEEGDRPCRQVEEHRRRVPRLVRRASRPRAGRIADRCRDRVCAQPARRAASVPRRRPSAPQQQHQRIEPAPAGPRPEKLDVRRQRRRRPGEHRLLSQRQIARYIAEIGNHADQAEAVWITKPRADPCEWTPSPRTIAPTRDQSGGPHRTSAGASRAA